MQKWRQGETASKVDWGLAVERESVIRPRAEEEKLTNQRLQEAMLRLGLSPTLFTDWHSGQHTSARAYESFVFGLSATPAGGPRFR